MRKDLDRNGKPYRKRKGNRGNLSALSRYWANKKALTAASGLPALTSEQVSEAVIPNPPQEAFGPVSLDQMPTWENQDNQYTSENKSKKWANSAVENPDQQPFTITPPSPTSQAFSTIMEPIVKMEIVDGAVLTEPTDAASYSSDPPQSLSGHSMGGAIRRRFDEVFGSGLEADTSSLPIQAGDDQLNDGSVEGNNENRSPQSQQDIEDASCTVDGVPNVPNQISRPELGLEPTTSLLFERLGYLAKTTIFSSNCSLVAKTEDQVPVITSVMTRSVSPSETTQLMVFLNESCGDGASRLSTDQLATDSSHNQRHPRRCRARKVKKDDSSNDMWTLSASQTESSSDDEFVVKRGYRTRRKKKPQATTNGTQLPQAPQPQNSHIPSKVIEFARGTRLLNRIGQPCYDPSPNDPDWIFFKSLIPHLSLLPERKRIEFKTFLLDILCKALQEP